MADFFVVVDSLSDWSPFYPSQDVITFDHYLKNVHTAADKRVRVINLCRSYKYLATGYYCSLLAEARGHNVLPSVRTLNDLQSKSLTKLVLEEVDEALGLLPAGTPDERITFHCWFGKTTDERLKRLAQALFQRFTTPLLEVTLSYRKRWQVTAVRPTALSSLSENSEQEAFANTFEAFSGRMWRKPKVRRQYRYDLAILLDPEEEFAPSDSVAIKHFIKAAKQLGIAAEVIGKKDYLRLPEYDALFIRATTGVNHYTYRFAKKAEAEGMVVIDDSSSILRCSNKIYLADMLRNNRVPTPTTEVVSGYDASVLTAIAERMGFPLILKIPDGSFSRGIVKVVDLDQLLLEAKQLLRQSALLLIQEFMFTDFDWRVGVLNNKPLYACRYYMVRNHWQIYQHGGATVKSGGFDTLPTFEVPKRVLDVAIKATRQIGNSLYGVDLKQVGDRVVIIEVNDNPSIDSRVEDKYLGDQLYLSIMEEFLRRMEANHR